MYGVIDNQHLIDITRVICNILGNGKYNSADKLILGTIAQETNMGLYRDQTPDWAGIGICQIEELTFEDIKKRTNVKYKELIKKELGIDLNRVYWHMLEYNPFLSILFCRLFYKLIKEEIGEMLIDQALYWKKYYNTMQGKGTIEQYIANYNFYVKERV